MYFQLLLSSNLSFAAFYFLKCWKVGELSYLDIYYIPLTLYALSHLNYTHGVNTLNLTLQVTTWRFGQFKFTLEWVMDSCLSNSKDCNSLFYITLSSNCILVFISNQSIVFQKFWIWTSEGHRHGYHSLQLCKSSRAHVPMLGTAHDTLGW